MYFRTRRASTAMEFIMLFLMVMGAMLIFQKFFMRAIGGRWKSVGDSFGFGRQYSPTKTFECACAMGDTPAQDLWYSVACADQRNCLSWNYACVSQCADGRCGGSGGCN